MPTTELTITPGGGFNAFWTNSVNTTQPTASMLFTDTDDSQWGCFANTTPEIPIVFHIVGKYITYNNPGLATWSTTDQHNSCTIAIDVNGFIWMCYDQHVTPLNCYKSNSVRNASAFTSAGTLVNATNELYTTFPMLFTNPVTHALYLMYIQGSGFKSERGFFYCYNGATWSGCPGTATDGQMMSNSFPSTLLFSIPQWDKGTGNLWFAWCWQDNTTPYYNCGDPTQWPAAIWTVGWTGSGFIDIHGSTVTLPMTPTNPNPAVVIHSGTGPSTNFSGGYSIDANGELFAPFDDADSNNYLQEYVAMVNVRTGVSGGIVQLTANNSIFTPPVGAGWLGSTNGCAGPPYGCGVYIQSATAFSAGTCTWVTYADIFNWGAGHAAYKSCDNFATSTFMYLTTRFNPNIVVYPDQVRNYNSGAMAFLFQQSNDVQYRFSTFISSQPNLYEIIWSPGGVSLTNVGIQGSVGLQ